MRGISGIRSVTAVIALACLALAMPAAGVAKPSHLKVALKLTQKGQFTLLAKGLQVKVRTKKAAKLKISATSTSFDGGTRPLARPRRVRFGRPGVNTVRLPLTAAGRKAVKSCADRTIRVTARGSSRGSTSAKLTRQLSDCRLPQLNLAESATCDFIASPGSRICMMPFPSDFYTVPDADSPTGKRINFTDASMPFESFNGVEGDHMKAAPWNDSDGFSPGQTIVLKVPGVDTAAAETKNGAIPINHLSRYSEPNQPVVLIDTKTGERNPIWVEIDSNADTPANTALEIHPSVNLLPKHRYIVALRHLVDANGKPIVAPAGFRYLRDNIPSTQTPVNQRRKKYEGIFKTLKKSGVRRNDLYLAWDFTVSSDENNTGRMLAMRDDAFASEFGQTNLKDGPMLGDAPDYTITGHTDFTPAQNSRVAREVVGTYKVPCYMTAPVAGSTPPPSDVGKPCGVGSILNLGANGMPVRNGYWDANFICEIPRSLTDGTFTSPGRAAVYGHGLFGEATQVRGGVVPDLDQNRGMVSCATDEIGMSNGDTDNLVSVLTNLSNFREIPDRLQQGILNELFLGRLMIRPNGLIDDDLFRQIPGNPTSPSVIDPATYYYVGASQGGIMGGSLTAVSPDFTKSALLVGSMNYSVLLPRSVDYDEFGLVINAVYDDKLQMPMILSLIQMVWDRGEPNGYVNRMTDNPLPNTPAHTVSLHIALGDHQVSNFASEIEARTVGMKTHCPAVEAGRWPDMDVLWGIDCLPPGPYTGSTILYFDAGPVRPNPGNPAQSIGTPPPPFTNTANRIGEDPHGAPRGAPGVEAMMDTLFAPNGFIDPSDVCGTNACFGGGYGGLASLP